MTSYSKNNNTFSFTLVELSIVIILIASLLSVVLIAKSLINSAKINKIYEEYRAYNNAILAFNDMYDCLPGDCRPNQILSISAKLPLACTVLETSPLPNYNVFNTGYIESPIKGNCAMIALQLTGYITNSVSNSYAFPVESIAGITMPFAKFSNQATWIFRTAVRQEELDYGCYSFSSITGWHYMPAEIGCLGVQLNLNSWLGQNYLMLRDANTLNGLTNDVLYIPQSGMPGPDYALSARLTAKLDSKFDDGMPYSGDIIGTLNLTDWNYGSSVNISSNCNTFRDPSSTWDVNYNWIGTISSPPEYLNLNQLGCLVSFKIK